MKSIITEFALTLSRSVDLTILVKSTLLLMLGLITAGLAVRAQASWRHLVFATTFATMLALPLVVMTAPNLTIEIPTAAVPANELTGVSGVAGQSSAQTGEAAAVNSQPVVAAAESWSAPSLSTVLRGVWIVGGLLLVLSLAVDLWRVRLLRRHGLPSARLRQLTETLAAEGSLLRPVEVLLHENIQAPLTYGFFRPVIMLPSDAGEWAEADLRRAIIHELEHVRRGDWATQLGARAVCAFYWFHPLVWMAWRKLCLEAERSCDDAVVQNAGHTEYAEQLVTLSRQLSNVRSQPILSMAKRSDLSLRVSALLNSGQRRGRAGLLAAACSVLVGGFVLVSIGPLRAVAQTSNTGVAEKRVDRQFRDSRKKDVSPIDLALYQSSDDGKIADINKLLDAGANVNAAIIGDGTPLMAAARSGHLEAVKLLLERGADPNVGVPGDGTALIVAAEEGRVNVVSLLLDRGADPNIAVEGDGNPLIVAAREGHLDIVTLLLDRGADVNGIVPSDENALIQASGEGHLAVVKLLVTRGADINVRIKVELYDPKGGTEMRSALSMARKGKHAEVISYLMSLGAR